MEPFPLNHVSLVAAQLEVRRGDDGGDEEGDSVVEDGAELDGEQPAANAGSLPLRSGGAAVRQEIAEDASARVNLELEMFPPGVTLCSVGAGGKHSVFSCSRGRVFSCGDPRCAGRIGRAYQSVGPISLLDFSLHVVVQVACGGSHTLLLDAAGRLFFFGDMLSSGGVGTRGTKADHLQSEERHNVPQHVGHLHGSTLVPMPNGAVGWGYVVNGSIVAPVNRSSGAVGWCS